MIEGDGRSGCDCARQIIEKIAINMLFYYYFLQTLNIQLAITLIDYSSDDWTTEAFCKPCPLLQILARDSIVYMALKEALDTLEMDMACLSCCMNMIAPYLDEVVLRACWGL